MARPAVIFYKKVTFSLPRKVVELLDKVADERKRSQYVAEAIAEKASGDREVIDWHKVGADFRQKYKPKPGHSSLEILRKFRYETD